MAGTNRRHHGAAPVAFTAPFGENQLGSNDSRTKRIHIIGEGIDQESILKNIDVKKNGFSIDHPTLGSDFIEVAWATNFEQNYPKVRDQVLNGKWPLTGGDREIFARMFSATLVKNHGLQQLLEKAAIEEFLSIMNNSSPEYRTKEMLEHHRNQVAALTKAAAHDKALHLGRMLLKYPWKLIKTKSPLFTGNAPLAFGYYKTPDGKEPFSLTGFRHHDFFSIAISPRQAIIGFIRDPNRRYLGDFVKNKDGAYDTVVNDENGDKARTIRAAVGSVSQFIYIHPKDMDFFRDKDGNVDLLK